MATIKPSGREQLAPGGRKNTDYEYTQRHPDDKEAVQPGVEFPRLARLPRQLWRKREPEDRASPAIEETAVAIAHGPARAVGEAGTCHLP